MTYLASVDYNIFIILSMATVGFIAWRAWDWLDGLVRGKVGEWRGRRKKAKDDIMAQVTEYLRAELTHHAPDYTYPPSSEIRYHIHFHGDGELTFATLKDSVRRLREQNVKPDQSGYYNALVPEDAVYALTSSPAWIEVASYFDRMITAPNEIGKMCGVRFFADRKTEQTDGRYLEGEE